MVCTSVILVAPYSAWQTRRRAFAMELMRPVTRDYFWREMFCALAWDVAVWTIAASVVATAGTFLLFADSIQWILFAESVQFVAGYVAVLWSMGIFLFGVALITMRFRYWLQLILSAGLGWCIAGVYLTTWLRIRHAPSSGPTTLDLGWFLLVSTGCGLLFIGRAYYQWRDADIA